MILKDLYDLIDMECTHNFSEDLSIWNKKNTIRCKIVSIENIEIEDKFPYTLDIGIGIVPIVENDLDEDTIDDMARGVCIDSLVFD